MKDKNIFDAGVSIISDNGDDDLIPHFIYCGMHYFWEGEDQLRTTLLNKMKNSGIRTAILTMLNMWRRNLVTKETVQQAYDGKLKDEIGWKDGESVHDDLEKFLTNLENNEIEDEWVNSFFTPKLTEEELKLVEERNEQHLVTYADHFHGKNPDVKLKEIKKSNSASKYVHGHCIRQTFYLTLESIQKRPSNENISEKETKKQNL